MIILRDSVEESLMLVPDDLYLNIFSHIEHE